MNSVLEICSDVDAGAGADAALQAPRAAIAALFSAALAGCGGGSDSATSGTSSGTAAPAPAPTRAQAQRFLTQSTFGATDGAIDEVVRSGYSGWIEAQFATPQMLHRSYLESAIDPTQPERNFRNHVMDTFWRQAITGVDQLRQRVAFALSEIFVVSQLNDSVNDMPRGLADYLDMLGRNAFGNFRQLLQDVSLHPMMGLYLSHLRNQKEDALTGRVPDENFAREVMQLFSIGLVQLNDDGTEKLDGGGNRIPTYTNDDIAGMARVFTGWSWAGPDTSNARFFGNSSARDPNRDIRPMQAYAQFHSATEKRFLGVTIAANTPATDSLRIALDALFNHANAGPFFARQLIQRLVTSNPSPAYVRRVAAAFANNGSGVRGDMRAVLRAVLLDTEARSDAALDNARFGKLREPVLRLSAWARAFNATSVSGNYMIRNTESASTSLGQNPLRSSSVFNFFRPGFVPPNTAIAAAGLVAPEFQITGETSVAGYLNFMRTVVGSGTGTSNDVRSTYSAEVALGSDLSQLVDRVDLLLTGNRMRSATRDAIRAAVAAIPATATDSSLNRARLAVYLTLASSEFLVQI